jgi:hypothetical protein
MINTKPQRSSPRRQTTSRNPNFALFALIFWYFFLIFYDLNRKHTNFQLNWTEDVAYKNSTIFSMKFKAQSWLRVRCLRSQIWASSRGQGGVCLDAKFDSTEFQKSTSIWVRMQKLWPFYRTTSGLRFWKVEYDSESKSGKAKTYGLWW